MAAPSLNVAVQGQGVTSADNLNTFEQTCDDVSQLRAFVGVPGVQVMVRGLLAISDGGAAPYYWNASGAGPDNGTTTIVPTGAQTGVWSRLPGIWGAGGTLYFVSAFGSLAAADAAAAAGGGLIIVDVNTSLQTNTTLASKGVVFAGGIISLGNFNLTFANQTVDADALEIFNYNGTGVVTGTMTVPACYVEWWGAKNDGTASAATLAAFQAANNYVAQSATPNQTIRMPGHSYNLGSGSGVVKASSFYAPNWLGNGKGTAGQSTIITYTPSAEASAFTFVGGSGSMCGGSVKNVIFNGNANTDCIEIQGLGGMQIDVAAFGPVNRVVLLNNKLSGQFTEFNSLTIDTNGSGIGTVLEYRVVGGAVSFHGSGLIGGVINFAGGSNSAILVNTGAFPYNAPLSATFFPGAGNASVVKIVNITAFGEPWFYGNMRAELGGATSLTLGTTSDFMYNGTVSVLGSAVSFGTLWQTSLILSELTGLRTVWFQPLNFVGPITGTATTIPWPTNGGHNSWFITVEVRGNNYIAQATAQMITTVGFSGFTIQNQENILSLNTPGYGDIVITGDVGAGITLSATSSPYVTGQNLTYYISITQIGQDVLNHSSQ